MKFEALIRVITISTLLQVGLAACQSGPEMSLDEAQQVTLEFERSDYTPPQRSVADVLKKVNIKIEFENSISTGLCTHERDQWWLDLFESQTQEIASKALSRPGKSGRDDFFAQHQHRVFEQGYYEVSIEVLSRALISVPYDYARVIGSYQSLLAFRYSEMGRFSEALESASISRNRLNRGQHYATSWRLAPHIVEVHGALTNAVTAEINGKLQLAETYYRKTLQLQGLGQWGVRRGRIQARLAKVLVKQNRLIEAEVEIREALERHYGSVAIRGMLVTTMADILFEQGRFAESEDMAKSALKLYDSKCVPHRSFIYARARSSLATALVAQEKWYLASDEYNQIEFEHGYAYPESFEKLFAGNLDWGMAMINAGLLGSGKDRLELAYRRLSDQYGDDHFDTAIALGHLAIARYAIGDIDGAEDAFEDAIPVLIELRYEVGGVERDTARERRLRNVFEGYLKFLSRDLVNKGTPLEDDVVEVMFHVADIARSGAVHNALAAANTRAVKDQKLADLVRQEQDLRMQLRVLRTLIIDYRSRASADVSDLLKETEQRLQELVVAHQVLLDEIENKFPSYVERLFPRAATVREVRLSLKEDEAMIAFYVARDRSYTWAVPKRGLAALVVTTSGDLAITEAVGKLRIALDPNASTLNDIPPFDLELAYQMYSELLAPVRSVWGKVGNLVVVTHGALGQLPIEVFPTHPIKVNNQDTYFAEYRKVPWLARKHSVSVVPSIATFREQRYQSIKVEHERAFIGFGDPRFQFDSGVNGQITLAQSDNGQIESRGIRLRAPVKTRNLSSATLESLPDLPETADEVNSIGRVLGADPERDLFLGLDANEENVYRQPLEKYRVIAFATHGLVPGDLNGLFQPALAFSNPIAAKVDGDGLLTLDEVLSLKLNADWVILSACNSGASDGAGSEAISGLGRAFFYAGAKSLLVTHWPVETISAMEFTTSIFEWQSRNPEGTRAHALQQARMHLIDGPGYQDETGETIFSYAHPLFWAPFTLAGDGGV